MTIRTNLGSSPGRVFFLLAVAASSCGRAPAPTAGPALPLVLDERDVVTVTSGNVVSGVSVSGYLRPAVQVQVKSSISGRVEAARVSRGVTVQRGEVVVQLDPATLEAQRAGAAASVAAARRDHAAAEMLVKAGSSAQADLVNAKASLEAAQARLAGALESLAGTRIASPITGLVTEKLVEEGGTVSAGERLFTVSDVSVLELPGMVDASELEKIQVGQAVSLSADASLGKLFEGKVSRIERVASTGTQQATVFIRARGDDGSLLAGLHVKGTIRTENGVPRPIVPLTAVQEEGGGAAVYVVDGGRLRRAPVVLGQRNQGSGNVEVTSGLAAGARVLVSLTSQAKDGARVEVGPVATPAPGKP